MIHRALKKSFYIHSYILLDFPLRKPITFVVILMYLQCQWSIDSMCIGLGFFLNDRRKCTKLFAEVSRLLVERDCTCLWKEIVLACRKRLYLLVERDCTCVSEEIVLIARSGSSYVYSI